MLQGQIYAVVFKDAVVFAQIVVAEADGVIVTSDDGEFHFRVSHQVTVLLSVPLTYAFLGCGPVCGPLENTK